MRHLFSVALAVCAAEAFAVTAASLSLKDGSTLKAELKTGRIACSTVFAKALGLDPAIVKNISFTGKDGEAKVELHIPSREDEMPGYAKRAFSIDEFKIYNYPRAVVEL